VDCPLCGAAGTAPFRPEAVEAHRSCPVCGLVFLEPAAHPSLQAERSRYLEHRNDPADAGYRAFLARALQPLVAALAREGKSRDTLEGLDFGCGPGPAVSLLLAEEGLRCRDYDPFFAFDPTLLQRTWDFVVATEVAEHLRRPGHAFALLADLLRPGGWLALMTRVLTPEVDFASWWYRQDPTHLCFYRPETFVWLAERHGWEMEIPAADVRLFRRRDGT
jgi:hypothetical protein